MRQRKQNILLNLLLGSGAYLLYSIRHQFRDIEDFRDRAREGYETASRRISRASNALRGQAARALKRLMPEVPIVMFSAYADSITEKEARAAGASVLVSKFEDISALVGIARNLVYPSRLDHLLSA